MQRTYFVKLDIDSGKIILDITDEKKNHNELLIPDYRLSEEQGKMLSDRLKKYKKPQYPDAILECRRIFYPCKQCGYVVTSEKANKAWNGLCEPCFRVNQKNRRKLYDTEREEEKALQNRLERYKRHIATTQGRIDAVPIEIIESNIRLEMFSKGLLYKDLARTLRMTSPQVSQLFYNKYIKAGTLKSIAKFIGVDLKALLKVPKEYKIEMYNGIPASWFDPNSRIRHIDKDDEIKE